MKTPLVRYLLFASFGLSLALGGVLIWVFAFPQAGNTPRDKDKAETPAAPAVPEGKTVERKDLPEPAPVPKKVGNPDRVRSNLQAGKTYATHTKGTLHVRGEDRDWGLGVVVTINYAFEADIDRDIESNDGTTVVELRHFRDIRSVKVDTRLEDLRLDLGEAGETISMKLRPIWTNK